MSLHKKPLTPMEETGLRMHGLPLYATPTTEPAPLEAFRQAVIARGRPQYGKPGTRDEDVAKDIALYEAAVGQPAPQAEPAVTEAMVTAYLTANDAYWKRIDGEPMKMGKWRNDGTPSDATRVSLAAALAAAPQAKPADRTALRDLRLWHWRRVVNYRAKVDDPKTNRFKRREYGQLHAFHLGAVQALNELFPIGDTAERDDNDSRPH